MACICSGCIEKVKSQLERNPCAATLYHKVALTAAAGAELKRSFRLMLSCVGQLQTLRHNGTVRTFTSRLAAQRYDDGTKAAYPAPCANHGLHHAAGRHASPVQGCEP